MKALFSLLLVSPVYLQPHLLKIDRTIDNNVRFGANTTSEYQEELKSAVHRPNDTTAETLNSPPMIMVIATNAFEKPVLKHTNTDDVVNDAAQKQPKQARQFDVPVVATVPQSTGLFKFISVPRWVTNMRPIVLLQKAPTRIWAIGSVSKFPPFFENFVQRIQSFYSIYKYEDLSRPATLNIINPTYPHLVSSSENEFIEIVADQAIIDNYDDYVTTDAVYDEVTDSSYDESTSSENNENSDETTK